MSRVALALLAGILLGCLSTLATVEVFGGWYDYEIRPASRCYPDGGATISLHGAEPVPGQSHPCLFRRPRYALFSH